MLLKKNSGGCRSKMNGESCQTLVGTGAVPNSCISGFTLTPERPADNRVPPVGSRTPTNGTGDAPTLTLRPRFDINLRLRDCSNLQ